MKKILFLVIFNSVLATFSIGQTYSTSAEIYLGLKKMNVLGSVLYIAAHPDDENTRLITYFSKERLYRTGYLSMTRGDGGQNLIGDEQGIELGLIRTQELLAARRIDGGEQFFTRAYDFGYSKTPEETFEIWDRDKILSDIVWVIRNFQPDVIITRFPASGGGHGHHTASAILANEAFDAAADPSKFPEQLKYVKPWQARRIVWNSYNFRNATPPEGALKLDVGGYNPVLGKSYGEISAESRSQHKSQGFGASGSRGESFEYFTTSGGKEPEKDLFEDIQTSWEKIGAGHISKMIESLLSDFDFLQPERSVKGLVKLYTAIRSLPDSEWKKKKLIEVKGLIEACSGLFLDATTSVPFAAKTDSVSVNFVLNNRLGVNAVLRNVSMDGFDSSLIKILDRNRNEFFSKTFFVPAGNSITQPYWLKNEKMEGYYVVNDQALIGKPDAQPALVAKFKIKIEGEELEFNRGVQYKFNDPVRGEVYQPFVITPSYTVNAPEINILVPGQKVSHSFEATAHKDLATLEIYADGNILLHDENISKGGSIDYESSIAGSSLISKGFGKKLLNYSYNRDGSHPAKGIRTIHYDHIPHITYFKDAVTKYIELDIKTAGKKIGYIVGAGDKVPQALEEMGYEVTLLSENEISRNGLQQFDAIVTGVRAYNTNDWLNKYYEKLMKYVEEGGNLVVQYNTSSNLGPVRARIGPYDFTISRNRITNENAPVTFLYPDHQVLNFPNKIEQKDFSGWIQERSIYHASDMDTAYKSVFNMSDPGENAHNGSLVIAPYGKGYFTYTGIVFFRQLPAGVPGAYRLFANIIALNQKKEL